MKSFVSPLGLRRISQGVFLILFLFLFIQTESKGADSLGYPVKIFLNFDPLVFFTTVLSSHQIQSAFYYSFIVVAATAFLGRVFCGWVCPLGTLNNVFGALKRKRSSRRISRRTKYYLLIFLLSSSLFSLQLAGYLDPLSLLIRSLSLGIYPGINYAARSFFDSIYQLDIRGFVDVSEAFYSTLRKTVLAFQQPFYRQAALVGSLFIAILLLNSFERRYWCRYLCPLGALLGLVSRYSVLKRFVGQECSSCGLCSTLCQTGASHAAAPDETGADWRKSECIYCMNCSANCPRATLRFGFAGPKNGKGVGLERRHVFISFLSGVAAAPLIRQEAAAKYVFRNPLLIRPPGALEEGEFLKRCIKCGECMKVCITNGLQPTLLEAGLEGIWSPMLVPKLGYCEYRCTLCGQVCPTGAIKRLDLGEKARVKIGLAMIDKNRCLPHAHATPCIVCEEVCPTPKKAIWFETIAMKDREGREITVQQPKVDLTLCVGCGICEAKCPVSSRPAIYVTSVGESRSKANQVLLPYS